MLVPTFRLDQENNFIIIIIRVPYVKISKSEFYIEGNSFKFYLHPYLLNLTFQQELKQSEDPAQSVYNYENFELTVKLEKKNKGEHFEDLQMLTKLINKKQPENVLKDLKKSKKPEKRPLIEVLGEESGFQEENKQQQDSQQDMINLNNKYCYGFNDQYSAYFNDLEEEILEIGELNPDIVAKKDRIEMREQILEEKFDEEHYLFDFFDNEEEIMEKMYMELKITKQIQKKEEENVKVEKLYSEQEWMCLTKLPNKQFILDNKNQVFLELADIAFAYFYELRSFDDEFTCESATTLNKLSSVLSCFVCDNELKKVMIQNYKRALVYPLYRHFELCQKVQNDVSKLFMQGKLNVLKMLLGLKLMFDTAEPRYLLNKLYIEDYCIIVQHFKDEELIEFGQELGKLKLKKFELKGFGLDQLEKSAEIVMQDLESKPATEQEKNEAEMISQKPEQIEKNVQQEKQQEQQENTQQQQKQKVLIEDITEQMGNTNFNECE